jgi:hypothetical protein
MAARPGRFKIRLAVRHYRTMSPAFQEIHFFRRRVARVDGVAAREALEAI